MTLTKVCFLINTFILYISSVSEYTEAIFCTPSKCLQMQVKGDQLGQQTRGFFLWFGQLFQQFMSVGTNGQNGHLVIWQFSRVI